MRPAKAQRERGQTQHRHASDSGIVHLIAIGRRVDAVTSCFGLLAELAQQLLLIIEELDAERIARPRQA